MQGRMSSSLVPSVRRSKDGLMIPNSSAMEVLPPEPSIQGPSRTLGSTHALDATTKVLSRDSRPFSAMNDTAASSPQIQPASRTSEAERPLSVDAGRSALKRRQDAAGRPPLDPSSLLSFSAGAARAAGARIPAGRSSPRPPPAGAS
jgi:hypothetical protein